VTPPENIQDIAAQITREAPFYSDLREKQIAVKGLGIGDVLEFETHSTRQNLWPPGNSGSITVSRIQLLCRKKSWKSAVPRERPSRSKAGTLSPSSAKKGQIEFIAGVCRIWREKTKMANHNK